MEDMVYGIGFGHLVYFTAISYSLCPLGIFNDYLVILSILVCCTNKSGTPVPDSSTGLSEHVLIKTQPMFQTFRSSSDLSIARMAGGAASC
jgi:hypothetical protein